MIILYGPSACGKTEVAKELMKTYGIKKVITHTTRQMRVGEQNDIDYHFVTRENFLKLKNEGYFVETAFYNGNYYGSSKDEIKDDKCCILEPAGVTEYKLLNNKKIVIFYMYASEETRRNRMLERKDTIHNIISRIENDRISFTNVEQLADFIISSEEKSVKSLASEIYALYLDKINKI